MQQIVIKSFIEGPFSSERAFSKEFQNKCRLLPDVLYVFSLEDAEMNKGAPDIFTIDQSNRVTFYELKYVGDDGMIRFQREQPLWYKRHPELLVHILIWDSRSDILSWTRPYDVIAEKSLNIPCVREYAS